jgi:rod shape-determining protein MreD
MSRLHVRRLPVFASLLVSLMLAITPLPESVGWLRPDFVALTLIYWSMMQPRYFSLGTAWLTGILVDVMQGTMLGQHAMALTIIVFITIQFHLRIRVFPVWQKSATVLVLVSIGQFLLFWTNGVIGISTSPGDYLGPVLSSTLVWPLVAGLLNGINYHVALRR